MTEIVNLNKTRKAKARVEDVKKAAQNRIAFGRTNEEKERERLKAQRAKRQLEGHKLTPEENE